MKLLPVKVLTKTSSGGAMIKRLLMCLNCYCLSNKTTSAIYDYLNLRSK